MDIIIAEDQPLLRDTLKLYLEKEKDFNIIDTVSNGEKVIESCNRHNPDLVIMDIQMPVMTGIEATKILKSRNPNIKILILSLYEKEDDFISSIISGADGYLLKDIEPGNLISSIRLINSGLAVYNKNSLQKSYKRVVPLHNNNNCQRADFTEAEIEVIKKICEGKQNKVIADELNSSLGTVKNRIASILSKTGLSDRTQVVIYALKEGILV